MPGTALPANAALTRHVIVDAPERSFARDFSMSRAFFSPQKIMVA